MTILEIRPNCECCDKDLANGAADARICTFECTFCATCAEGHFNGRCPNCGGNLVVRPTRPADRLVKFPASDKRVHKHHACCAQAKCGHSR